MPSSPQIEFFVHDLWLFRVETDDTVDGEDGEEIDPAWIADEEEDFREELDKNGDGKLDREEIEAWVMPNDYYNLVEEAKHLISEADSDKVFQFRCVSNCYKKCLRTVFRHAELHVEEMLTSGSKVALCLFCMLGPILECNN